MFYNIYEVHKNVKMSSARMLLQLTAVIISKAEFSVQLMDFLETLNLIINMMVE